MLVWRIQGRGLIEGLEKEVVAFLNARDGRDIIRITIAGGLEKPYYLKKFGMTEEDFFGGCSVPRNKEIMRVFRGLEIVEHLGSGVPRIVNAYGKEAFEIRDTVFLLVFMVFIFILQVRRVLA